MLHVVYMGMMVKGRSFIQVIYIYIYNEVNSRGDIQKIFLKSIYAERGPTEQLKTDCKFSKSQQTQEA